MRDQIARADRLYERAARASRCCCTAAARCPPRRVMYREILRQIEREGYGASAGPRRRRARRASCSIAARRGVLAR